MTRRTAALGIPLVMAAIASCGVGAGTATSLPSIAASPADPPTPPATAPATPAATSSTGRPSGTPASQRAGAVAGGPGVPVEGGCTQLTLTISSDKPSYSTGQTVHLTATLTNTGTVTCTFEAGAQRGFAVASGATAIWRSGCSSSPAGHTATEPCPQFLALMPIRPGQAITRTQDWSQQADGTDSQVAAGRYLVAESWAGDNASASITIS